MDKVKGLISESDFVDMSTICRTEKERLEKTATATILQIADIEQRIAAGDDRDSLIEQYLHPKHLTREMVVSLIDHICVGKRVPGAEHAPVEIHWNF